MNLRKILLGAFVFSFLLLFGQQSFAQVTEATMQQIQLLLQEKSSRTPAQRKMDSHLLQAVRENRGQKMAAGVELDAANVNADAAGILSVDIKADINPEFISKITALGGKIIYASAPYHTVRASISLKAVETIAAYPEVKFIQPAVKSMVVDLGSNQTKAPVALAKRIATIRAQLTKYINDQHPTIGSVTSQGDVDHRAADVRTTYGFQGAGIKIGVLSDSYNAKSGAAADIASGDLPGTGNPNGNTTPVTVVQDYSGGADEGRAMLQVIHDLAPKAQLFFATADVSEAGFATNILALRNTYGCNIIVDDVAYFDEPAFQDGITAQAVNTVTASGALYFSSAGNSGSKVKGTSGVFEGDFNDAGSAAFAGSTKAGTIHNFGTTASPVNGDIITAVGEVYNLGWSDPIGASSNDYDLFLVSAAGKVKKSSTNVQSGTQDPYEQIAAGTLASGDRLVVFKTTAAAVRAFHLNTNRGTLTVSTNGQTTGHADAVNAFCMAATPGATAFTTGYPTGPYPNAFVSTNKVEPFSSDGPRKIFYNPDGTAITPGNVLFGTNGGKTLAKPDLTAADGVSTTFAASTGLSPFFGTSCAAPHAGAIAALILSGNPSLTAAQVRAILTSTALDVESAGYDNVSGYGIIQAFQAAGQVGGSTPCGVPVGLTATSVTSSAATLNWTAVSGATSYAVDYKAHTATTWTSVATAITAVTANVSGLTASTLYDYRVKTTCASGTSAYDTAQFTTTAAAACGVPAALASSNITTTTATVSWGAVTSATSYAVDYKIHTATTWTSAATATTATTVNLSSLTASTLYDYRVSTTCASGTSAYDTAQFTTAAVVACGVPVGLTATSITTTTATINWAAVSGATSYAADYKVHTATTWTSAATATTAVTLNLTGLTANTLYDYRVKTTCASGTSAYDTAQFTTAAVVASCNGTYDGTTHSSFATAVAIPSNTNVNGTISTATDVDYYKFTVTTKGTATITLTTLPGDYDLYIYNSSQTQVASSIKSGTTSESISKSFARGTFYIKVIGYNGAFNASTCYTLKIAPGTAVTSGIDGSTSTTDLMAPVADNTFSIYPNPVKSVLTINASALPYAATVKVIDIYGKTILTTQLNSSSSQINVGKLSSGTYLLMMINKDGSIAHTSKFVKQ